MHFWFLDFKSRQQCKLLVLCERGPTWPDLCHIRAEVTSRLEPRPSNSTSLPTPSFPFTRKVTLQLRTKYIKCVAATLRAERKATPKLLKNNKKNWPLSSARSSCHGQPRHLGSLQNETEDTKNPSTYHNTGKSYATWSNCKCQDF